MSSRPLVGSHLKPLVTLPVACYGSVKSLYKRKVSDKVIPKLIVTVTCGMIGFRENSLQA